MTQRITKEYLMKLINEEKEKLNETLEMGASHPSQVAKKTKEVDADSYASTLEQCVDHYKMCKLKEAKLIRDLKKIQEIKQQLKTRLLKELK